MYTDKNMLIRVSIKNPSRIWLKQLCIPLVQETVVTMETAPGVLALQGRENRGCRGVGCGVAGMKDIPVPCWWSNW